MARGFSWFGIVASCASLSGVGAAPGLATPTGAPQPVPLSTAMLAPPPESSLAFCRAHGGTCDPVPVAAPMPDGRPALAPIAWRDYCRRNRQDPSCVR